MGDHRACGLLQPRMEPPLGSAVLSIAVAAPFALRVGFGGAFDRVVFAVIDGSRVSACSRYSESGTESGLVGFRVEQERAVAKTAPVASALEPTGRKIAGPAFDLIEGVADNGLKHLTLVHHPAYLGHACLTDELQAALGFMEQPEIAGVVRLAAYDPGTSAFSYPCGTVWPVAEIVRTFADLGAGAGVKAGLELCYLVAELLTEASQSAGEQGLASHGSISPWTVVLKQDGQPAILGYGLPQVDLRVLREGGAMPTEDGLRYAPPERLEGADEDLSTDLFALTLVSLELMMGRPVYDGLVDDIRQQASRGEGMRRLYQWRESIPDTVREVLGRALKPDPDTRYRHGADFIYELHDLLGSLDVEGPPLVEAMAKVRALGRRRVRAAEPGESGALSSDDLREIAADLEVFDDTALPPPRVARAADADANTAQPRWTRARRRDATAADGESSARERLKRRLRTHKAAQQAEASPEPAPRAGARTSRGTARERLKRRLEQGRTSSAEPASGPEADAAGNDTAAAPSEAAAPIDTAVPVEAAVPTETAAPSETVAPSETAAPSDPPAPIDSAAASEPAAPSEPEPSMAAPPDVVTVAGEAPEIAHLAPDVDGADEGPAEAAAIGAALRQSAAAELLEKLRTTGSSRSRRRARTSAEPSAPAPHKAVEAVETPDLERDLPTDMLVLRAAVDYSPVTVVIADPEVTLVVPGDRTAASLVFQVIGDRGRVPVDMSGRITGWWRLHQQGRPVLGTCSAVELKGPLTLGWVPNFPRLLTLEVRGPGEPVRFQSPVGIAVPSRWLVAHLVQWLSLSSLSWELVVGDTVVHPDQILDEVLGDETVLVVRPA